MAFNVLPKNDKDIDNLNWKDDIKTEVKDLLKELQSTSLKDPLAIDANKKGQIKIFRGLDGTINLKALSSKYKNLKLSFGNGSRGNRGSNNTGNLFEGIYTKAINDYIAGEKTKFDDSIEEIMKLLPNGAYPIKAVQLGELNQKRPLHISSSKIYVGSGSLDIGKTVTDIDLIYKIRNKEDRLHLSLKKGGTVTFVNAGVKKYFIEKEMKEGEVKNKQGLALLKMLDIDNKKFCDIFNSYTGKESSKKEIVKANLNNSLFKNFLRSVIGYGFVLVHQVGNKVHILNMTKQTMEKFLTIKSAEIQYPVNGSAKRIDILVKLNGMDLKINIRNKQGGIYPTHIMSDYKMSI